jgi:hypothetical protein
MAKEYYKLIPPSKYAGRQIMFSSDRVLINARNDSVLIFANKAIGLSSAGTVNIDSDRGIIFNSPKIHLGIKEDNTKADEPLLLGNKTEKWLNELIDGLIPLIKVLESSGVFIGIDQYPDIPKNYSSQILLEKLNKLKKELTFIKSNNVYTI